MPERALRARLAAVPAIVALVGDRIRPLKLEQQSGYPALLFRKVNASSISTMGRDDALTGTTFEVESWSPILEDAIALARLVRASLARWGGTAGGVVVQQMFYEGELQSYDPELRVYRISQDYSIWYEEA